MLQQHSGVKLLPVENSKTVPKELFYFLLYNKDFIAFGDAFQREKALNANKSAL